MRRLAGAEAIVREAVGAAAALETEKHFRKVVGHRDLWMLKAALEEGQALGEQSPIPIDEERLAA